MVSCFPHLSGLQLWQIPVGNSLNSSRQSQEQHIYFLLGAEDNSLNDILINYKVHSDQAPFEAFFFIFILNFYTESRELYSRDSKRI